MIITKEVQVRVNNKNIKHLESQNLYLKYGEMYEIEVKYLPRYSKYRVVAQCETCGFLQELSLQIQTCVDITKESLSVCEFFVKTQLESPDNFVTEDSGFYRLT